ncbi:MAG: hypothetical protein ACREAU_03600 [Nitrosopumilaceae archaeon]
MKKTKTTIYLSNKELLLETLNSKKIGRMTPKLTDMLMLLTQKYAKRGNFAGYTYNSDMQSAALLMLVKNWSSFNPAVSENPFAFYTQIIKNAFIQVLNIERKHRDIRDELLIKKGLTPSFTYTINHEDTYHEGDPSRVAELIEHKIDDEEEQ